MPADMDVSSPDLDKTANQFDQFAANHRQFALGGASEEMEDMLGDMKIRTPVDTGILRGTLHVEGPEWVSDTLQGAWVAGGPSASYAIPQHEDETLKHVTGQAKFMSSVAEEREGDVAAAMSARISEEIAALFK